MTTRQLASAINYSIGTINNWEQGKRCPDIRDVQRIEEALAAKGFRTNGYLNRYLEDWVHKAVSPEWSKWREIEENADTLLSYENSVLNGLLQTEDYARVVLGHDRYSPLPLEERLRFRLERQKILDQQDPPTTVFIFDECVLHHQVGSRKIMYEQIMHLIDLARREEVIIQVVRQESGYHAGFTGAFMTAELVGKKVGLQDGIWTGYVLDDNTQTQVLTKHFQHIQSKALTQEATLELLKKEAEKWKP